MCFNKAYPCCNSNNSSKASHHTFETYFLVLLPPAVQFHDRHQLRWPLHAPVQCKQQLDRVRNDNRALRVRRDWQLARETRDRCTRCTTYIRDTARPRRTMHAPHRSTQLRNTRHHNIIVTQQTTLDYIVQPYESY